MVPEQIPIRKGMYFRHDDGPLYLVDYTERNDATGFEKNGELSGEKVVDYTQLEQGEKFPAGTEWSRPESEFRLYFTFVSPLDIIAE